MYKLTVFHSIVLGPFFARHGRQHSQDENATKPSILSSILRRLRHPFSQKTPSSPQSDELPSFVLQGHSPSDLERGELESPTLIKCASPVYMRAVQHAKHGNHDIVQGWTVAMESEICEEDNTSVIGNSDPEKVAYK